MKTSTRSKAPTHSVVTTQLTTFGIGDLLFGIDIQSIQEINRQVETTPVPHSPAAVRGVVNLRGDVVTVMDLRVILDLEPIQISPSTRTIIVRQGNERTGLLVDAVADVVTVDDSNILTCPANVNGIAGRFFRGVVQLELDLLVVLSIDQVLGAEATTRRAS
jgi:purine-binding chemotaxis protein CheW